MAESVSSAVSKSQSGTSNNNSFLDRFFHLSERGVTPGSEIRAGVVTFFAMAYIIILNPLILGAVPDGNGSTLGIGPVASATALVAGIMTIAFGLVANYPFGIAAGLGINTMVAVTLIGTYKLTWPEAMGLVVIDGIIIFLMAVTGIRNAVFHAIPRTLKIAISVGIGAFIALIGLVNGGIVTRVPDAAHTTVPVGLGIAGSIASWPSVLFLIGLAISAVMVIRKVPGGLFLAIVINTILAMIVEAIFHIGPAAGTDGSVREGGWNLAIPKIPNSVGGAPDLSIVGHVNLVGAFGRIGFLSAALLVFTLVLANFFDAMGTMTGLGKQAGLVDDDGVLPDMKKALGVEGFGAIAGGLGSSSSATVYADSSAGIADGARTGLANVTTGVLFLIAMFFTPLYEVVPIEAAAPVLVVVGVFLMGGVADIDWTKFHEALPAFLTIMIMPFTYSIANGIGMGIIAFVLAYAAAGKAKEIHWVMWVLAVLFIIFFGITPITTALGA